MTDETQAALTDLLLAREVETFIYREVALLDDRRFEDWTELFTEDGYYWAPATMDQEDPHSGVSLFFDDVPMMRTRFARLRHPRVHSQIPPSRTSHMVSNIGVTKGAAADAIDATAKFEMLEYRPGHEQRSFGGSYTYALRWQPDTSFRIAFKKAVIINCDDVHLPIAVPF